MATIADRIRQAFHYDATTGSLTWRAHYHRTKIGRSTAAVMHDGYRRLRLDGVQYQEHRVIWLWMTGSWPTGQIDHLDGDRENNVWANLRDVTPAMNSQNLRRARRHSKSGLLGVCAVGDRWQATIGSNGRKRHLGTHDTKEAAFGAYLEAKRILHPGNTL